MRSFAIALIIIAFFAGCAGTSSLTGGVGLPNSDAGSGAAPNIFQPGSPSPRWAFIAPSGIAHPATPVLGGDHHVWISGIETDLRPGINRIATDGSQRDFPISPKSAGVTAMTLGPDGDIWFTIEKFHPKPAYFAVGTITPSGSVTQFELSNTDVVGLNDIAAGPDGDLWVTCQSTLGKPDEIDKITTSGGETRYMLPSPPPGVENRQPRGIVAGSDGAMWFAEAGSSEIGRITINGAISEYPLIAGSVTPTLVARGSDQNVWFTYFDQSSGLASIAKITPGGSITDFQNPRPEQHIDGLTLGPDGALWFGESTDVRHKNTEELGRLTSAGVYDTQDRDIPQDGEFTGGIDLTTGSDGDLWVTEGTMDRVAVFLWRKIAVVPSSVTVAVGHSESIAVSETNYSGGWTAASSNRSIATVTTGQRSGTFVVHGRAAGSCDVIVSDSSGNSYSEPVTVQ